MTDWLQVTADLQYVNPALGDTENAFMETCAPEFDNVDTAQMLAMLLESSGHAVRVVHDGPTALEASLNDPPDVVLLDIGLPGLSGYEVATRMRQQPGLGNVILVAMTGYGQESDLKRSQEAGLDHHLVKPADFSKVQKILAGVGQTNT